MKTLINKIIVFAVAIFATVLTGNAQGINLEEASNIKGVTSIYVSKMMLSQVGDSKLIGDVRIEALAKYLNSLEIVIAEDRGTCDKLRAVAEKLAKTPELEVITRIKEDDELVAIYGKAKGNVYESVLLVIDEVDDMMVILITGDIPLDKIAELTQ